MAPPEPTRKTRRAPAVPVFVQRPTVLTRRADFLAAARGPKAAVAGFVLQARRRAEGEAEGIRVGFTCSRKVGNAVARNRAKRRLREAAARVLPAEGRDGWDYVLIGRRDATEQRPWPDLLSDLSTAIARVHGERKART